MVERAKQGRDCVIALMLFLLTVIVFLRASREAFIVYDDPMYVTENTYVQAGLTPSTLRWAMTSFYAANWHPLTWLSHASDEQLFGAGPAGPHCVNVILHASSAALLFLFLLQATGERWPSAFAAALFAWHPLRVESVAWVAERKDVLCGLFFFLTLLAYVHYVRRPSLGRYALIVTAFALGLMAKPMLVTIPFLLLVIDFWPLQRRLARQVLLEKLPLCALSAASSALTFCAQRGGGAVVALTHVSLPDRLVNAAMSYGRYLMKTIWPTRLSVFYPMPEHWAPTDILAVTLLLALMTILCVAQRRQRPFLLAGWLWYLGMLVPVIGIVQVGSQSMADRYSYLPAVGLCIIFSWEGSDLWQQLKSLRMPLAAAGSAIALALALVTIHQIGFWRDSQTLFHHALDATGGNYVAHVNLGADWLVRENLDNAEREYQEALREEPGFFYAHNALGLIQVQRGRLGDAKSEFERSLRLHDDARTRIELGNVDLKLGLISQAESEYERAAELDPAQTTFQYNWGNICVRQGRFADASDHFRAYLTDHPDNPDALNNLGVALAQTGDFDAAAKEFARAVAGRPDDINAQCGLAASLAHLGRWSEAAEHYQAALGARPGLVMAQRGLDLCRSNLRAGAPGN